MTKLSTRDLEHHATLLCMLVPFLAIIFIYVIRLLQLLNLKVATMLMVSSTQRDHVWVRLNVKVGNGFTLASSSVPKSSSCNRAKVKGMFYENHDKQPRTARLCRLL